MAKIVKINNPIARTGKEIINVPLEKPVRFSKIARQYGFYDGKRYIVSKDGEIISTKRKWPEILVYNDDIISIVPYVGGGGKKGKMILSIIGTIALSAATAGAGAAATKAGFLGLKGSMAGSIASLAVSFLGGLIIQKLTPKPKVDTPKDALQTYEWQLGGMETQQGGAIPVVYGVTKPLLTVLSQHVVSEGDKQYVQMLLCPCEGPIDEIRDIRIDKNPIANYKDVQVETRLGTNTQKYIASMGDIYSDQALGYELIEQWRQHETEGDAGEGVEITIEFPAGLYYSDDSGGASSTSVTIKAEIKKEDETQWRAWDTWTITEAKAASFRRVYKLSNLEAGRYHVRVCLVNRSGTSLRHINKCYWNQLTHVIYKQFDRPGKALIGIRALATDQLSGSMPEITCEVVRSKVWVYNPYKLLYEQKPADNPAWACYDLWHRCELVEHPSTGVYRHVRRGVPKEYMIYDDFNAWAEKCDENNLKVNIAINSASKKQEHINSVALCGRGSTLTRGTKIGCVFDCATDMVQIFNVGNIMEESFEEQFLSLADRANIIELSYHDKERGYQSETVLCYSQGWEKVKGINNPSQIRYDGITSREQAWREAAYQSRKNRYEVRTISITVKYEAIACQVGDVIGIQHDIPQWGSGGRIVSATENSLALDRKVYLAQDVEYDVLLRYKDDSICTKKVLGNGQETDVITFSEVLEKVPEKFDLWVLGETGKAVKPFRVLNITRSGNSWTERKLSCMEYIKEVYIEDEDVPDIDYAIPTSPIRGLMATNTIENNSTCHVELTWLAPRERQTKLKVFVDGNLVTELPGDAFSYSWEPNKWGLLEYKVACIDAFGNVSSSCTVKHQTDKPLPPDVENFNVTFIASTKQFIYEWSVPDNPMPIDGYEVRRGQSWSAGQIVRYAPGRTVIRDDSTAVRGESTFWICAKNRYGYSQNPLCFVISVGNITDRDVVQTVSDYEETGTIEGYGDLIGGNLIQHSGLSVGYIKENLWSTLKELNWLNGSPGGVRFTGKIIDIGKPASVLIWINEEWIQTPDTPNYWEYQTSFDDITWSDWRPLPLNEIEARYFKFRATINGKNIAGWLKNATIVMDVPENTVRLPSVQIPIEGIYVEFYPEFVNAPSIQITPNNDKRIVQKTQISGKGCYVQLFDAYNNEAVDGIADVFATGF